MTLCQIFGSLMEKYTGSVLYFIQGKARDRDKVYITSTINNLHALRICVPSYSTPSNVNIKEYSENWGLIHPISVTPIDRYSLKKLMFNIAVGFDFMLARYAG